MLIFCYILFMAVFIAALYWGQKHRTPQKTDLLLRHRTAVRRFLFGYILFQGCFFFPLADRQALIDWYKVFQLLWTSAVFGLAFAEVCGPRRHRLILLNTLIFTLAGMACRYLLEYGEVSNTYNFTGVNIALFVILVPAMNVFFYHVWLRVKEG